MQTQKIIKPNIQITRHTTKQPYIPTDKKKKTDRETNRHISNRQATKRPTAKGTALPPFRAHAPAQAR